MRRGIFCNKDLLLNLYLDNDVKIEDSKPTISHDMFDRGEYIGILGNEVDYQYGEDFNSYLRSDIMRNFRSENQTLKPDSIDPNDSKYVINETIKEHRLMSINKNRLDKIEERYE